MRVQHHHKTHFYMTTTLMVLSFFLATLGLINEKEKRALAFKQTPEPILIQEYPNPFDHIKIEGRAAYVVDVRTGKVIYEKNSNLSLPLASLTKVMTALTASNVKSDSTIVEINAEALATEGEYGLMLGEHWKLKRLMDFALVKSSNDAATAVAIGTKGTRDAFIQEMNTTATHIGLAQTKFFNETGLDISSQMPGAYGTAEDMGKLMSYILTYKPTLLEATRYDGITLYSEEGINHSISNTNKVTGTIPNLIASKTGYTELAGGNLVVAFDAGLNRPIAIAVLGSSQEGRFRDVVLLASTTLSYISLEGR